MAYAHESANYLLDPNDTADVQIVREPTTYASTILLQWAQIHRVASIPTRRTIALLAAYMGVIGLVLAALLRLM